MFQARKLLVLLTLIILAVFLNTGCGHKDKPEPKGPAPKAKARAQEEGWIFGGIEKDLYHVRLVIDAKEKKAHATVLDETESEEFPIAAATIALHVKETKEPIVLNAKGEKGTKTAIFTGTHERFAEKINPKMVEIAAEIRGKNYIFTLEEEEHDHKKKK